MKIKRVYLKDGKANTRGEGDLIGYLNSGIIIPYKTFKVDKETETVIPVSDSFADSMDKKIKLKFEQQIMDDFDIN